MNPEAIKWLTNFAKAPETTQKQASLITLCTLSVKQFKKAQPAQQVAILQAIIKESISSHEKLQTFLSKQPHASTKLGGEPHSKEDEEEKEEKELLLLLALLLLLLPVLKLQSLLPLLLPSNYRNLLCPLPNQMCMFHLPLLNTMIKHQN